MMAHLDEETQGLLEVDAEVATVKREAEPILARTTCRALASWGLLLTVLGSVTVIAPSSSFFRAPPSKALDSVSMSVAGEDDGEESCASFRCPDGFRLKSNAPDITKMSITLCCDEAMCRCDCDSSSTSSFCCNFEVRDHDCGAGYICNASAPWRYTLDRYQTCQRTSRLGPSNGELHTFYVYRSGSSDETFVDAMNVANAVGQIVRLHQEVIGNPEYWKAYTIIRRLKVTVRPTSLLVARNRTFGDYLNYDQGRCSGPIFPYTTLGWDHPYDFCFPSRQKYGRVVGCINPDWNDETFGVLLKEMIWYSLPGPCPTRWCYERDAECIANEPSGRCDGPPTGAEDCTYSVEPAGVIGINELCGYSDFESFYGQGNLDYDPETDKGIGCSFWDGIASVANTKQRAAKLLSLFKEKFGAEDLKEAYCHHQEDFQDFCPEGLVLDKAAGMTNYAEDSC